MNIRIEYAGNTLVAKLEGELDQHVATELRTRLDDEISKHNIINLIFDFKGVTFMDSSGIGVIVGRYKKIQARGGTTMVIRVQPQVDRVLEISGIKKILMCSREGENRGELYEVASAGENI